MQYNAAMSDAQLTKVSYESIDRVVVYDPFPVSQSGQLLDLTQTKCKLLPERVLLNFELVDPLLREHAKAWVSFACKKYANISISNHFNVIKALTISDSSGDEESIQEQIDQQVRDFMQSDQGSSKKSVLRTMYGWFVDEGFPFFDDDFFDLYLDVLRFGSDDGKGKDVIMNLPNRGPLTLKEQGIFRDAMKSVHIANLTIAELQGMVALKIGQVLGARDIQVIKLKFRDIAINEDGTPFMNIPRAKQRGYKRNNQYKKRPITKSLFELITLLKQRYESSLGEQIEGGWPLICNLTARSGKPRNINASRHIFQGRRLAFENVLSLGFKVTNRRLRKTFCTQLIAKGTPLKVVAELMDHTDLQQLEVYYRHTHHIAKKLNDVLKLEAKDIIDAFAGKVVSSEAVSQAGQQIFAPMKDQKLHLIGSCASKTPCSLNPPLSCYGCASLEAFDDVDHKSVVESFVSEAKETFGEGHAIEILKHKDYLAASKFVQQLEDGEL
jgi:hypothetical protein